MPARPFFRCDLKRPALPVSSLRMILGLVLVWLALPGIGFIIAGAWPVMGFLGLEFLLLGGAFWVYLARAGRVDSLQITDAELVLRRTDGRGRVLAERRIPPHWVRVQNVEPEGQPLGAQGYIEIRSHGQTDRIGEHMTYADRAELVADLNAALRKIRV